MVPTTAVPFGQTPFPWPGLGWYAQQRCVLRPGTRVGAGQAAGQACYVIERGLAASYVTMEQSRLACVGLAGPGAVIGLDAAFHDRPAIEAHSRAVVELQVVRVPAPALRAAMQQTPALQQACLQQLQARLVETQHIAACNARHLLPTRCAHWLLRLQDQLGDVLPVTHEFLAALLGVRRAGVTVTLQALQRNGAIQQQRGKIVIVAPDILRQSACSCPIRVEAGGQAPFVRSIALPDPLVTAAFEMDPRARIKAAIQGHLHAAPQDRGAVMRIGAVLQVCRRVMEQTQELLAR